MFLGPTRRREAAPPTPRVPAGRGDGRGPPPVAACPRPLGRIQVRLRRVLAVVLGAAVSATVVSVITASPAAAHGAMMTPGSRTYLCWQDGLSPQGNIVSHNPACGAAVGQSGSNSLYNWFSVLRSDGAGRMRGFIPDGKLCSGGNPGFAGYDLPRGDWPQTHLTAGRTMQFRYSNWAAHPGWFYMYVTKDSWSPTRALTWDDLEPAPFLSIDRPPQVGSPGTNGGHYYWSGALPANKTGKHVIYSVWSRSDSTETFYGCSDVTFDGGNGEVTGVGPGGGNPNPNPTPSPTNPTPSPTTPTPSPTTPTPSPTTPGAGISCTATVRMDNTWNGGFQATVTVRNTGGTALRPWVVGWHQESATLQSGWNATVTQTGHMVTAQAPDWNPSLAPGASASVGFTANGSASPPPSAVSLNGVACG